MNQPPENHWDCIALVGVGLLGGSIGLAVQERGLARRVVGIGRRIASLRRAEACGAVTEITTDLAAGVAEAQLVIVCTPVELIADQVREAAAHAPASVLLTDVGSIKAGIVADLADGLPPGTTFIGSHPMAGSEKTGADNARADLLVGRLVVVTPTADSPAEAVQQIEEFWQSLGARVQQMSAAQHDEAAAAVSHLPHLVASALSAVTPPALLPVCGTGWTDTTRIAAGDVELWRQILTGNRAPALMALAKFEKVLDSFRTALESGNDAELLRLLTAGKRNRDALGS